MTFYGVEEGNEYSFRVVESGISGTIMDVLKDGEKISRVRTLLPGTHNAYNSLAAFTVGHRLGFPEESLAEGINACRGVRRRFERIGGRGGVVVIDDYAHHPTEVKAVLEIAGKADAARVIAVFQPHRYTRTRMLAADFGRSFAGADVVVVADVYGAGEDPEPGVTGRLIADSILESEPGKQVEYVASRADLARMVSDLLKPGDMVITIGAGDVTQCAREILELLPGEDEL